MGLHSGWRRVGVVLTGLWVVAILAFTAYEFYTFPIGPFDGRTELPSNADYYTINSFYFVGVARKPWKDSEPRAAAFTQRQIEQATTATERNLHLEVLNSMQYRSELLPMFYVVLLGGVVAFWSVGYSATAIFRWVREGFDNREI